LFRNKSFYALDDLLRLLHPIGCILLHQWKDFVSNGKFHHAQCHIKHFLMLSLISVEEQQIEPWNIGYNYIAL